MESANKSAQPDLTAALAGLWTRFLPEIRDRVSILESAIRSLGSGSLAADEREAAHSAAHKLAGTLGTFGLEQGTVLARELELAFSVDSASASPDRLVTAAAALRTMIESHR